MTDPSTFLKTFRSDYARAFSQGQPAKAIVSATIRRMFIGSLHTKLRVNRRVRSLDPEALDGSDRGG